MSIEWPEEVVERVARALCEAWFDNPDDVATDWSKRWELYRDEALAALNALGGERVWCDRQSSRVYRNFSADHTETCYSAILIKLEGE